MPSYREKEIELKKYRQQRKKKKRRTGFVIFLFFLISGGIVGTMFFAPIFNITEVFCTGNYRISANEIIGASGAMTGENIFRTSIERMKVKVAAIPYVKESNVRRVFPNRIKIWVRESEPMAIVAKDDIFLAIDEKGKVLETIDSTMQYKIPIIRGLDITKHTPGTKLSVENIRNMDSSIECLNEIINNNLLNEIISIDVSNINEINLNYENRINVNLGNSNQIAYKIKFLKNIVANNIASHEQGVLDFTGENPYFRQTD